MAGRLGRVDRVRGGVSRPGTADGPEMLISAHFLPVSSASVLQPIQHLTDCGRPAEPVSCDHCTQRSQPKTCSLRPGRPADGSTGEIRCALEVLKVGFPIARDRHQQQHRLWAAVATGVGAGHIKQCGLAHRARPSGDVSTPGVSSPSFAQRAGNPLSSPMVFECHPADAHAADG